MVQVDLITGFLGAGKTTFMQHYLRYLEKCQQTKVHIIENEFGPLDIDSKLLKDEAGDISSLAGMCMCCTGLEQFKRYLVQGALDGYHRILVEPSGIYDVDEFFTVMQDTAVSDCCEIGNIIMIVDAQWDDTLTDETKYLMCTQLLASGVVIMSKTQLHARDAADRTEAQLKELIHAAGAAQEAMPPVLRTAWDDLTEDEWAAIAQAGWRHVGHVQMVMDHGSVYASAMLSGRCEDLPDLEKRVDRLFSDASLGSVLRVKGFVPDTAGNWYVVNSTRQDKVIAPVKEDLRKGLLAVIGQGLDQKALREVLLPKQSRQQGTVGAQADPCFPV